MLTFNQWTLVEARSGEFLWASHNGAIHISGRRHSTIAGDHDTWVPRVTGVGREHPTFDKIRRGHIEADHYNREVRISPDYGVDPHQVAAAHLKRFPEYRDYHYTDFNGRPFRRRKDYTPTKRYTGD